MAELTTDEVLDRLAEALQISAPVMSRWSAMSTEGRILALEYQARAALSQRAQAIEHHETCLRWYREQFVRGIEQIDAEVGSSLPSSLPKLEQS